MIDHRPGTPGTTFRRRLREVRRRAGLSQIALAERVAEQGGSLNQAALTRIERGDRDATVEEALLLAAALGVSPLWLMLPSDQHEWVRLGDGNRVYETALLREWIRGSHPMDLDSYDLFAQERPDDEKPLWTNKYLAHWLARVLTDELVADIKAAEGHPRNSTDTTPEAAAERLDGIESRARALAEEVTAYVRQRRRALDSATSKK